MKTILFGMLLALFVATLVFGPVGTMNNPTSAPIEQGIFLGSVVMLIGFICCFVGILLGDEKGLITILIGFVVLGIGYCLFFGSTHVIP